MPIRDDLGTRMKTFYENIPKTRLMRRTPVAIRLDGKAFHTFTKGFQKPFDIVLMDAMQNTMKYLCENIQGCVFGYTQSDEITLILIDYQKFTSDAWFDYEVQKMASVSASMATMAFNNFFESNVAKENRIFTDEWLDNGDFNPKYKDKELQKLWLTHKRASEKGAMFDARCFNIPKEEVTNLIYWRQLDATRNSIQMVGQANFSHDELQGKTCSMIQDMLMTERGINWNNFIIPCKRGTACIKVGKKVTENVEREPQPFGEDKVTTTIIEERPIWIIDRNMPILKGEDRKYVDDLIYVGEE
jgi:tRNA(His) 5'-end guanylyltransferase